MSDFPRDINDIDVFLETGPGLLAVMESTESRFAHLLQPIRELTKNWDIDVAAELNDYLEEVKGCRTVGWKHYRRKRQGQWPFLSVCVCVYFSILVFSCGNLINHQPRMAAAIEESVSFKVQTSRHELHKTEPAYRWLRNGHRHNKVCIMFVNSLTHCK